MRCILFSIVLLRLVSNQPVLHAADDLPTVPDGFFVDVVATEPMVSNPCVMAFDSKGRLCVAQGPQWRAPTPETPGDHVDILIDEDRDGVADRKKTFAEGFNSIQGIAWHGSDLWIANAPDLTVVRDTDDDDEADVYIKVYTGLGNLEHSLHGLNFGPDGKLYMSKGNSKGYNRLDQLAPRAFRDLWGIGSPEGAPDYTEVEVFTKETYQRAYHTPQDDWGQQGGILRCDPYPRSALANASPDELGRNLEIFSRGFRNPWDICFDDGFNWLGTDNDQTEGDKVFAPFFGAHFGWGHPWSFDWKGIGHLPTVPISMPLYEGSGAGVIHYSAAQFPKEYQGVFFVNDWMRREVYLFRPEWHGALLRHHGGNFPSVFAHADSGRSLPSSSGRVFEPTDIEVGPDGALYILSWGHGYGGTLENGKQVDAGRVYRIRYGVLEERAVLRKRDVSELSLEQLFVDLGSCVPAWRVNAQNELLRRGDASVTYLKARLMVDRIDVALDTTQAKPTFSQTHTAASSDNRASSASAISSNSQPEPPAARGHSLTKAQQTWGLWTLGRLSTEGLLEVYLAQQTDLNVHLQCLRILAQEDPRFIDDLLVWHAEEARLRHASVQAAWQGGRDDLSGKLVQLAAQETDRVVFYSIWNAMLELMPTDELKQLVGDSRPRVRLAALLALFLDDALAAEDVLPLRSDRDSQVAALVELWLQKTGNGAPLITLSPPPGEYSEAIAVTVESSLPRSVITYTIDGSVPAMTSPRVAGPIAIDRDTRLRFSVFQDYTQAGAITEGEYLIRPAKSYRHRPFIHALSSDSGRPYEFDWSGLAAGKRHYTDRDYRILEVPSELAGLPFLRTANGDDRRLVERLLTFRSDSEVTVMIGVDARNPQPLRWMHVGQSDGFQDTGLQIVTTDPVFNLFAKKFPAGEISLGPNINQPNDTGRGNYIVVFKRDILQRLDNPKPVTIEAAIAAMKDADPERGREFFLHPQGAGCFKCHQMQGIGQVLGPDLSDIGNRAKTPEVLLESILHPSKVITEGFAQQRVLTTDGRIVSGSILEETGRFIKLASSNGSVTTVAKDTIEQRTGTETSPMPDGFATMMTAQQLADLTAWLLTQKTLGDRDGFWFQDVGDSLHIHFGRQQIATYLKDHPQLTRRALVNVRTPSGLQVTRNYPPRVPEDIDPGYTAEQGIIHPHMHPGIWISFGDVNGNDYWRLQSKVIFADFVQPPNGNRTSGGFVVRNLLMPQDANTTYSSHQPDSVTTAEPTAFGSQDAVCVETTRYHFEKIPEGLLLHLEAEYRSDDHDFYFGDQEESGLAIRVASPIRVQGGNGTILNDRGERNGAQVWGKDAKWFDYFGTIGPRSVGVMVVPNPSNPRPSWLHARDYGVIVTNPFPKQPQERREPYVKTWVRRGETYQLSYAILIHESSAESPFDRHRMAEELLESFD